MSSRQRQLYVKEWWRGCNIANTQLLSSASLPSSTKACLFGQLPLLAFPALLPTLCQLPLWQDQHLAQYVRLQHCQYLSPPPIHNVCPNEEGDCQPFITCQLYVNFTHHQPSDLPFLLCRWHPQRGVQNIGKSVCWSLTLSDSHTALFPRALL